MGEPETTGTPGATQDDADAATAASGTPAATTDGGDAAANTEAQEELARLREIREKYLAEKDTVERVKRENDALRAEREQYGRGYQPPTAYDPATLRAQRAAQLLQSLNERDPEVVELFGTLAQTTAEETQRQNNAMRFNREMDSVPADQRGEVERISRAENLWPSLAYDRVRARQYDKERKELEDQRRKLQDEQERLKRGVVKTTAAPSTGSSSKETEITRDDYDRFVEQAERGDRAARKKLDDVEHNRIRIRSG